MRRATLVFARCIVSARCACAVLRCLPRPSLWPLRGDAQIQARAPLHRRRTAMLHRSRAATTSAAIDRRRHRSRSPVDGGTAVPQRLLAQPARPGLRSDRRASTAATSTASPASTTGPACRTAAAMRCSDAWTRSPAPAGRRQLDPAGAAAQPRRRWRHDRQWRRQRPGLSAGDGAAHAGRAAHRTDAGQRRHAVAHGVRPAPQHAAASGSRCNARVFSAVRVTRSHGLPCMAMRADQAKWRLPRSEPPTCNIPNRSGTTAASSRWAEATTHVMAHALHYGSSVFEGIRSYETPNGPAIFRLTDHNRRLFESAQDLRHGDSVFAGRDQRRLPRRDQGERPDARPTCARSRSAGSAASASPPTRRSTSRSRRWQMGAVPRRRRARTGHRRLRVELAALRAEHDSRGRQGRRQLSFRPADRARGAPPRFRRRHRAGVDRPAQRRRGREPVPGLRRRAAHHAGQRGAAQRHHPQHADHAGARRTASKWSSATCRANTCTCATSCSCAARPRKSRRSARSTASRSAPASPGPVTRQMQELFFGLFDGTHRRTSTAGSNRSAG